MAIAINGTGTITGISVGGLNDSIITSSELANAEVTTAKIADNAVTSAKYVISVAHITDTKAQGTHAGTFTNGAWRTRDLNTIEDDPDSIVTLSSNQFTLGAGTYLIEWSAPAIYVGRHQTRLYDVTGTTGLGLGSCEYSDLGSGSTDRSMGFDVVTLTANNIFEIQHHCSTTRTTNGLGNYGNFTDEKYAMVTIFKLS